MDRNTAAGILGVGPGATGEEVDAAFRATARTAHPDSGGDRAHFELLVEARGTLAGSAPAHRTPQRPLVVIADAPWWRRLLDSLRRRPSQRQPRVR